MTPRPDVPKSRRPNQGQDDDSADGARIVYHAVRRPFYRKPRIMIPLAVGSVFAIGIGLGTTLGLMLAPTDGTPSVEISVENSAIAQSDQQTLPSGEPLPVAAYGSDRERESYELAAVPVVEEEHVPVQQVTPVPQEPVPEEEPAPEPVQTAPVADQPSLPQPVTNVTPTAAESSLAENVLAALQPNDRIPNDQWRQYAAPSPQADGRPRIAIVIDDLGIDQIRSARAINLPAPLTLAIIPYGYNLQELSLQARRAGHEVLVHMPMAPMGLGVDPGPNALHRELGPEEIIRRIRWNLSRFDGYVGVNNHMGSRFTADAESMALVISEVQKSGLLYLDSVTTPNTQGFRLAAQAGIYHAVRDVFLDNIQEAGAIREQLSRAERIAREQGHAIVIGHPHDETIAVLTNWISEAQERGFQMVPLSAIVSLEAARSES